MILFFHFMYLIARYIVLNISKTFSKPKILSDEHLSEITSQITSIENCSKSRVDYPKYPIYENGFLKFFPPVFVQRYETVAFTLQDFELEGEIRKVVDFGCAELGFFVYLKSIESITEILEVDIDSEILERYSFKAAPLTSDYLMGKRDKPLDVYILAGNVADYDDYLLNCDAVVAIELIEHLTKEDFEKMPYNIFYRMKPKIAIFTTPNADFNPLLPNFSNMRHKDHKFEWTRKEFYKWTQQVLKEYPEYSVRFFGIGAGPEGTENLGCCSQMAVFQRLEGAESFVTSRDKFKCIQNYKLIKHYEFPAYVDYRTTEEKIVHEIQYHAAYLKGLETYYNFETNKSEIPLSLLKEYVSDFQFNDEDLMKILIDTGMTLKNKNNSWFLVYSDVESNSSSDCNFSESWLNEDIPVNNSCNQSFEDRWSDEEQINLESFQIGAELKFRKELSFNAPNSRVFQEEDHDCVLTKNPRNGTVSENSLEADDFLQKSTGMDIENHEGRKSTLIKSKIPCEMIGKETQLKHLKKKETFYVCKSFKRISKSNSLDSCLENINFRFSEQESYLKLIRGSSSPFHHVNPLSSCKRKHWINYSDSSLLNSTFDKAGDIAFPFSFLPPGEDRHFNKLMRFTQKNMSGSTSLCSEIGVIFVDHRLHNDIFMKNLPAENGDVVNNNRDR